jgi:serine/threonine protein kinase
MSSRYEILETLDQSPEPKLWKAWDSKLQRYVVLRKIIEPEHTENEGAAAEAAALCGLQHPHIVSVYNVDDDPALGSVAVMEYLNGRDMHKSIARGVLESGDFLAVADQSLEGLVTAHKLGILHKRLSPSSIMLTWLPDDTFVVKLVDFAFGVDAKPKEADLTEDELRKAAYYPPEQFLGHTIDQRSDLYSLGCSFYFMLTGQPPFTGGNLDSLRKSHLRPVVAPISDYRNDIEPKFAEWVLWLMNREPDDRPRDAAKALEMLRSMVKGDAEHVPDRNTGLHRLKTGNVSVQPLPTSAVPLPVAPKKNLLVPGLALVAAAAVCGVVFFKKEEPISTPQPTPSVASSPTVKSALIPPNVTKGLTIWLTADSIGVEAGGKVARWTDLAELGGRTEFLAVSTDAQPTLFLHPAEFGFTRPTPVLRFEGQQQLLYKAPLIEQGELDKGEFTLFIVNRMAPTQKGEQQRLLGAAAELIDKAWDVSWEKNQYHFGVRIPPNKVNRQRQDFPSGANFHINLARRDKSQNKGNSVVITSQGKRYSSREPMNVNFDQGKLAALSIGSNVQPGSANDMDYLRGDLVELLIYSRSLDDREIAAVEIGLAEKYFTK